MLCRHSGQQLSWWCYTDNSVYSAHLLDTTADKLIIAKFLLQIFYLKNKYSTVHDQVFHLELERHFRTKQAWHRWASACVEKQGGQRRRMKKEKCVLVIPLQI